MDFKDYVKKYWSCRHENNAKLALALYDILSKREGDWFYAQNIGKKMAQKVYEAPLDITAHYERRGTLKNMNVKGMGPKTISELEEILEKGSEGVVAEGIGVRELEIKGRGGVY